MKCYKFRYHCVWIFILFLHLLFSVFEKDDTSILSLLDVGYNRVSHIANNASSRYKKFKSDLFLSLPFYLHSLMFVTTHPPVPDNQHWHIKCSHPQCIIESPHVSILSSELRQIQHSLIRPQNVIATQQALYAALHRVKDTVIITDDALRIQYMNKQAERILGMKIVSTHLYPLTKFSR
jgi:PAS domain-containing protein